MRRIILCLVLGLTLGLSSTYRPRTRLRLCTVVTSVAVAAACWFGLPQWEPTARQHSPLPAFVPGPPRDIAVVRNATERNINSVRVFNAFTAGPLASRSRMTVGPDTFADITLISKDAVKDEWRRIDVPPITLDGIGGQSAPVVQAVRVPLHLQWGAPAVHIYAFIGPTPRNVDMLMGVDVQRLCR